MKLLNSVLKVIGWESTTAAVATEIKVEDPSEDKVEDILRSNEVQVENK